MKPINYVTEAEFPQWYAGLLNETSHRRETVILKPAIDWYAENKLNMAHKAMEQVEQVGRSDSKLSADLVSNFHAMAMLYYVRNK